MAITNKLITFNKLTSFETQLAQGNILETSIVFIKDAKKIWTKGTYFDCSGGGSNDEIGYTTEFSVADIEAVYGRGITKPINVQGLISAIEANKPIIIPTNITDASNVGGNAVTMAKMDNDGFIYLNVIVPYLDGVHKEYFIQIKITTAQLIKSGSNGSITLKELVAKTDLKTINGESILGSGDITVQGGGDNRYFTEFTVGDFERACLNESSLYSNGLFDAIRENKIICVPDGGIAGYRIASFSYSYGEISGYYVGVSIEVDQISYDAMFEGFEYSDYVYCSLPRTKASQIIYLDSPIIEYFDNTTYIIREIVNELSIMFNGDNGSTIRFQTGDNCVIEFFKNVLWANGVIPEIEPNTLYELSLTQTYDSASILAVLTPFKSV